MRSLVFANMIWNTIFVLMALSEMTGATAVHPTLPWYLKWWWITALAGGNLAIHLLMLRRLKKAEQRGPYVSVKTL